MTSPHSSPFKTPDPHCKHPSVHPPIHPSTHREARIEPITEVVDLSTAKERMQAAIAKMMEGDEEAQNDFDKWDRFIKAHPQVAIHGHGHGHGHTSVPAFA
jgi:hypothetical protein